MHLYTKWRQIVPQEYKDIMCPMPSEKVIFEHKNSIIESLNASKSNYQVVVKKIENERESTTLQVDGTTQDNESAKITKKRKQTTSVKKRNLIK